MIDVNGQYYGQLYGQDRIGQTTPDLESSEWLRPWLPIAYPAPYLPTLRQDQGHPKLASIVIGAHQIVGQDKNGGLVPAGLFCGAQPNGSTKSVTSVTIASDVATLAVDHAWALGETVNFAGFTGGDAALNGAKVLTAVTPGVSASFVTTLADAATAAVTGVTGVSALGGQYCVLVYGPGDVKFAFNAQTSARVSAAGQYAVLAAPADGAAGDRVTLPSGQVITIQAADLAFALTCDLFATGKALPIGCAVRNVYQYIGGVLVGTNLSASSSATGINYVLDGVVPINFTVMNYMHEMGTAIQTQFALKLPWIGATPTTLQTLANGDGITGYVQGIGRSFTHFTGTRGAGAGNFSFGTPVVASVAANGSDAGNFAPYNPAVNNPGEIIGRVIGIQNLNPVGFLNRVRTQFDRPMVGPMVDPNPAAIRMGGSATRGLPYHISVTTDAVFVYAVDQSKTLRPEYSTQVLVRVNL
ncbi:MAG: hypothetical protein ABR924_19680 [Terracidiphilus sp.]|jgi:hypothetical protein